MRPAVTTGVPTGDGDITGHWLSTHLGPTEVNNVERIGESHGFGGASYKVEHNTGVVVVKLATAERTLREQAFYEQCAATTPIRTPQLLGAACEDSRGVLLLEYVANARQGDVLIGCSVAEMVDLARTIGRLHATWWERAGSLIGLEPRPRLQLAQRTVDAALRRFTASKSVADRLAGLPERVGAAYDQLGRQPLTVTHRDFHLDNVLFTDEPVLIDWQAAGVGPPSVDVARLLIEVRPLDLSASDAAGALDAYLECLPRAVRPTRSTLLDWIEPNLDVALAGTIGWLSRDIDNPHPRMTAVRDSAFGFIATALDVTHTLRAGYR